MKTLFGLLALTSSLVISSGASAMLRGGATKLQNSQSSNFSTIRNRLANQGVLESGPIENPQLAAQLVIDQVIPSLVDGNRVLIGTTNAKSAYGSTTFDLPMLRQNQRVALRATLRANRAGLQTPKDVSSNPKSFHMDVNYLTAAPASVNRSVRLNYSGSHTSTDRVATRILTYQKSVDQSPLGAGTLVATVQQRAIPEQRGTWKTTATFLRFFSN